MNPAVTLSLCLMDIFLDYDSARRYLKRFGSYFVAQVLGMSLFSLFFSVQSSLLS
jgi:glycerol uptake facilitator-like aquaporin